MTLNNWIHVSLVAYFFLFLASVLGIFVWRVKRRGGRVPIAFKLLRGPGETIRRRIAKSEERDALKIIGASVAPLIPLAGVLWLIAKTRPPTWAAFNIELAGGLVLFVGAWVIVVRWLLRDLKRYRDDWLGYMGEREVAEHLMPLAAQGYRVFHDVPAEGAKSDFNLDHVVVGPAGVAAIEVKTRRKGPARMGMKDYVVAYDGRQLIWPWGEDRHGLEQAANEADWLKKFIHQRTGIDVSVKPILALPGWWVEAKARGAVAVVNSKNVADAVVGNSPRVLAEEQIDLIARQLETLCRDVED